MTLQKRLRTFLQENHLEILNEWVNFARTQRAVQRNKVAGTLYIFGNMQGQPFTPFSLQDCRPKGVSDKLARGDLGMLDATLHTSERMVRSFYDRRRTRVAKPVP